MACSRAEIDAADTAAATGVEFAAENSGRYTNQKCWLDFLVHKSSLVSGKLTRLRVAAARQAASSTEKRILNIDGGISKERVGNALVPVAG